VGVPTAVLVAGMGVLLALGIVLMAVLRHH
jgi:hypothetical protein